MIRLTEYGCGELRKMGLSPAEIDICQKILVHDDQEAVADSLFVTVKAVKFHLGRIYRKLGVKKMHGLLLILFPLSMQWEEPAQGDVRPEPMPGHVCLKIVPEESPSEAALPIGNGTLFDSKK